MRRYLITLTFCCAFIVNAQTTFTTNGPADIRSEFTAYIHATVFANAVTQINDATIVVKKGKIISVVTKGKVPAGAMVVDLRGKFIYPSFIDLYSSYGIKNKGAEGKNQRGEQFNSSKPGAFAWNEALKPEVSASNFFNHDAQHAAVLRNAGFGVVLTGNNDGICRGTTALVSTADEAEHYTMMLSDVTASFSFNKGSSHQPYPSSLMGSIALIRQTYYDAAWYNTQTEEKNISLEGFAKLTALPAVFEAGDNQNIIRAAEIAKEFRVKYMIKTRGDEYQIISQLKQAGLPLIVPVNFPKAYQIRDIWDADKISTADLKHWELAPSNLYWLWKNNISFAITYSGCNKPDEFLSNIRKAVKHGLPKQQAIYALTESPAKLIDQQNKIGQLKAGFDANFIICNKDIFDEQSCILTHIVQGKPYVVNRENDLQLADQYQMVNGSGIIFNIKKSIAIISGDTFKINSLPQGIAFSFLLNGKSIINFPAYAVNIDSSVYPFRVRGLKGFARINGQTRYWELSATSFDTIKPKPDSSVILSDSLIWYPFNDYGSATTKKQESILFKNATVWTNETAGIVKNTDVVIEAGKIISVEKNLSCASCKVIDATDMHLTSGIIDEHSHIAISNGVNEGTQAITGEVRIGDVINPDDINIYRQLAGGVTASQLLHGSANPIGGQSAIIKLRWGLDAANMKIKNAPPFIKFALGENVKQANWGDRSTTRFPQTRMGVEQVYIDAFTRAREYELRLKQNKLTRRDLELDALVEILNSKRFITCHSYVQSEINMLIHVADSFGFRVNTFTHILEGYKVADKLKKHGANASTFADWWAYKYEVMDAIPFNAAIMHRMGINVAINSDDAEMGRRLNQEAAKTIKYGGLTEEEAWKTVTLNPAKMLHLDNHMGSLKPGKDADIVLWNDNPLSIYAVPQMTFIDGICYFNIETDEYLRKQIIETRMRIIAKLLKEQKGGAETQAFKSIETPNYHCND